MSYNILIVDDSAITRAMIKRTIKLTEIPVDQMYEAADGVPAMEVLAQKHVDLVLADLNMPGMTGVELTHRMRQAPATHDIPVIIVSADPNFRHIEQLQTEGIQGYVRKPFTPENIRNVINQVLGVAHA